MPEGNIPPEKFSRNGAEAWVPPRRTVGVITSDNYYGCARSPWDEDVTGQTSWFQRSPGIWTASGS